MYFSYCLTSLVKIYSRFETNKKFRLPYHLANEAVVLTVRHTTDSTLVSFPDPTSTSAEGLGMRLVTLTFSTYLGSSVGKSTRLYRTQCVVGSLLSSFFFETLKFARNVFPSFLRVSELDLLVYNILPLHYTFMCGGTCIEAS